MPPTKCFKKVSIIGRPNVGKSTLFNLLVGKKSAIVSEIPGMTRDRNVRIGRISDIVFELIDTAGVDVGAKTEMSRQMNEQSAAAVLESDVVLFTVDTSEDTTLPDSLVAEWIRTTFKEIGATRPVILLANKVDRAIQNSDTLEKLGFGRPIEMSSIHKYGLSELRDALAVHIPASPIDEIKEPKPAIRIAILGRPNVGKSTLINTILGEKRLITTDIAGTTRDAIATYTRYNGIELEIIDTAGSRKNKNANSIEESLSLKSTKTAVELANVVILVVDSGQPFEVRDIQLAGYVIKEGRGLIIALNKCDLLPHGKWESFIAKCRSKLPEKLNNSYKIIPISATKNQNVGELLKSAIRMYDRWKTVIDTKSLNKWLEAATAANPSSSVESRVAKFSFIRQISSRPPSFIIFGTRILALASNYVRYLENSLREHFGLKYIPIRILVKQKKNPFNRDLKPATRSNRTKIR